MIGKRIKFTQSMNFPILQVGGEELLISTSFINFVKKSFNYEEEITFLVFYWNLKCDAGTNGYG